MVYESDFYTTRRPYRSTPSYSTYTVSTTPSRQVRILPGLGKVHVIHTYDRIVPYIGHKKLTVVTVPPRINATRASVLRREYDWIENKLRPWVAYSPTNRYLNSDSAVRFVYYRNPITGLKYHSEYNPSRYYNFYRIVRPQPSYDDYWAYYRPLSQYSNYWPFYRYLSYIDDAPVSRSLKLQRKPASLTGLAYSSSYYPKWYNYYLYYRYYWPSSHSYDYSSWPSYRDYDYYYPRYNNYYHYYPKYISPFSLKYWPYWSDYRSLYYDPKRSYYWQKYLPMYYSLSNYSTNYAKYLDSIFDDETRLIRAQTASLLKQIHIPVPRIRTWPITALNRYGDFPSLPAKYSNDTYIHRLLTLSPNSKVEYATYYTEPVKKYIGQGHLSCVSYAGDKSYNRRRPLTLYEDAVRNDIQLLSYYINRFREEKKQPKEIQVPLSSSRPSRIFNVQKPLADTVGEEIKDLREARAARLAKIYENEDAENSLKAKRQAEEARLAEEKAIAEEQARKVEQAKKEEAARQAELARQEKLAAQAAAERAAELARQEEVARQAELERQRQEEEQRRLEEEEREQRRLEEEERARQEEEERARQEEEARIEEERKALIRLEEIARQAEEEREAELARQAEELAELARQEEQERQAREQAKREEELAELARQEAELAELERQERELAEEQPEVEEAAEEADDESEAAIAADSEQPQELTDEDIPDDE